MPIKLKTIKREKKGGKEFVATFDNNGKDKTIRFGTASNFLLNPKKTEADKNAYIARHKVNENFSNPMSAGSLSKHILWNTKSFSTNVASFKRKFKI